MADDTTTTASTAFAPLPDEQSGGQALAATGVKQIAISRADMEKYGISEESVRSYPALIELILHTESMKDEERKYWFQLLPIMTAEQIEKLQKILQNERDQLAALDAKYEAEVSKLNSEHLAKLAAQKAAENRAKIAAAEAAEAANENQAQEDILKQIEGL